MGSNCVASVSIGCLFCCKGCNAEKIRNAFTFIPPPPSYEVQEDSKDRKKSRMVYLMEGLLGSELYRRAAEAAEVRWVTTRKGSRVPVVWLRRHAPASKDSLQNGKVASAPAALGSGGDQAQASSPSNEPPSIVLLHCHGNATDIGMMMGPYYELSKLLGIEVVGVEYSGYGAASGKPSSGNTYADVEAAYDMLVEAGIPSNRIVAYGQSIGSGPLSGLAVKRPLGGIILHSPLLSGIKVIDPEPERCCRPSCVYTCFDFFPNDRRAHSFSCPVFIMHGQRDDVVPFYHGKRLHEVCPKAYRWKPYFPPRAGHNDIVETDMRLYFSEVSSFLHDVKRRASGIQVPQQVEMAEARLFENKSSGSSARLGSIPTAVPVESAAGNEFAGANDAPLASTLGSKVSHEPVAGPEDGRYQKVRAKGDIWQAAAGGNNNARELQVVCQGDSLNGNDGVQVSPSSPEHAKANG